MNAAPPQPHLERLAARREHVRRNVLRANRAVGVILALVLLLGTVLVWISLRARQSQQRAEHAEAQETERLWKASLAQAQAENLSTKAGHREAALTAVRTAARIRPTLELRNEAIAALAQRDLVLEREWKLQPNAYGFQFDPDLKYYVVRYTETVLSMYRLEDNSHVRDFPMPLHFNQGANVGDFMFSHTGKYLIIRYNGGPLTFWEPETGALVRMIGSDPTIAQYAWPPTFNADDTLMGLCMHGSQGTQFVYDLEKAQARPLASIPEKLRYTKGGSNFIRISPAGDVLAAFAGNEVYLLDATTGEIRQKVTGPSLVQFVTWDRQGQHLSFSCDNFTLFVWEPKSGRVMQMGGSVLQPWCQDFTPDGQTLMTSGSDGLTRLWDVPSARLISEVAGLRALFISRDGTRIGGGLPVASVSVWRIQQPDMLKCYQGAVKERATVWQQDLSTDGRFALWTPPSWVPGAGGYELFDLRQGGSVLVPQPRKVAAGFRPGHAQLWTAEGAELKFRTLPSEKLTDAAALESTAETLPLPPGFVATQASFSADGRTVAVSGTNKTMIVLATDTPEKAVRLEPAYLSHGSIPGPGSSTGIGAMAISPDARWVIAGRYVDGGHPIIWDAQTGKIVHRLESDECHVGFSSDGRYLLTAGIRLVRAWSVGEWKILWERSREALLDWHGTAALTGDGSLLAWARGATLLELTTISGEKLAEWNLPGLNLLTGLRFSADGGTLFAGGGEGRMLAVDMTSLRRELAGLHLDWPLPAATNVPPEGKPHSLFYWPLVGIVPVGLAALLGVLVLRRQGRLTSEFVEATELASQHEHDLAAEREVSELKSRFVTTVSHEFRTPLGITMSAVELLRHYEDRLPPEEKTQLYDDIHSATRNMASLMEQVLVLGRVDAGKLAYHPAPLDLDILARKLTDESHSATNRKCLIEWTAENDLSAAAADEALLRHIFSNLLSNGVKYSPANATIHFRARREGPMAVFSVQDQGIGIPAADLPNLFEAFQRGSNVGEIPGTGLGLVIIKRCVDLHQGSIQVQSEPGTGTTFTVRVPAFDGA